MRDQAIYNTHPHIKSILDGTQAFDADGKLAVVDEALVQAELPKLLAVQSLVQVRSLRAAFFPILAGLQAEAIARGNTTDAMAIANIQQGARDITATVLTGAVTKAEIEAKYKAAWLAMLATAPASVIAAFRALSK